MTELIAWIVFPVVLGLLSLGCGLLLARVAAMQLPGPLLLPAGFVVVSLATQFAHMSDATAALSIPLVVTLAVAGLGLSLPWRVSRQHAWWLAAGIGVFAVFLAPVVLSGQATFAGYIKLDDTATYLAMLDRGAHHAYNASGLAPSTYEAVLKTSYVYGYPLGSVLPLGVGSSLVGQDPAWVWQPYIAFLALLAAVGLYELVGSLLRSRLLRAFVAFVGAQAALIYGYALWGGVKELATTVLVVLLAALVQRTVQERRARGVLPIAATSAAMVGTLSIGGAAWLAPLLAGALVLVIRARGLRAATRTCVAFVLAAGVLSIPAFVAAATWLSHAGAFTSGDEYGNLLGKLSWLQVFGIWPNGDFRTAPKDIDVTHVLVALVAVAAVVALVLALRSRAWPFVLAEATAAFACLIYVERASPWIGGKSLASAAPIVLAAALTGAAAVFERGRRVEGAIAIVAVAVGVIWSNVLQYHDVYLAPSQRLTELATIGHRFAGQGPALMTEFEAYGARHFLRTMDTEAASELRRHYIYLRSGSVADTGVSPDIDEVQLRSVLFYRTLVLRRSGLESRPPSAYSLVWSGRYYQVWQRDQTPTKILEHLSLGSRLQPAAVPRCSDVLGLARLAAANNGLLAAVMRPPASVIEGNGTTGPPAAFGPYGEDPTVLYPRSATTVEGSFKVVSPGTYSVWIGGTFRSRVDAWIDGKHVGSARDQLAWPSNFDGLGELRLDAGPHVLRVSYAGPDWRPGSGGEPPFGFGPFAVAKGTEDRAVSYVQPSNARSLCGKSLDWIEAMKG